MNSRDPDPTRPSSNPYAKPPSSGSGGIAGILVFVLFLLLAGGAAYYFVVYKKAHDPAGAAGTGPDSTPAVATPNPPGNPTYGEGAKNRYIQQAQASFMSQRHDKSQVFVDAYHALSAAGGYSPVGLTSKEAIAARRDLVAKAQAANADYTAFIAAQETTYRAELAKTPLVPNDVNSSANDFVIKAQTADILKLRDLQRDSLKAQDDILAFFDRTYGSWKVPPGGKLTFTKQAEGPEFTALQDKYKAVSAELLKLQAAVNTNQEGSGAPTASPSVAPGTGSPATAAPGVSPAVGSPSP